jgi:hypothetical protein
MKIKTVFTISFIVFISIYSAYTQQFNTKITPIGFHFSIDASSLSSVYEWRQEVCTLGCRATGFDSNIAFNMGINLQFRITDNLLLQPGFQSFNRTYIETGFLPGLITNNSYEVKRKIQYLSIPITLRQVLYRGERKHFFVQAGVSMEFLIKNALDEDEEVYNNSLSERGYSFTGGIGTTLLTSKDYAQVDLMLRFTRSLGKYNDIDSIIAPDRLQPLAVGIVMNFRLGLLSG